VLRLAEQRAEALKQLGVRNIAEAAEFGVHFHRVFVLVDEVAELAHDHDADRTADRVLRELLRIVQLVRAMGIHVILCGQRFGSDLGKLVTSIRAQVSGRICLQVNDPQTAEMVLAGLPTEVQKLALSLNRPGMAIVQDGQDWHYGRCAYLTPAEVRAPAAAHAAKRMTWDALAADAQAAVATYAALRWQERAR
jgi:S-DNA-T family DNA segregation ATPase FtsK/SpoIIIE